MVFRPNGTRITILFYPDGSEDRQQGEAARALVGEAGEKGGRMIPDDLFAKVELERAGKKPLTVPNMPM